MKKSFKIIAFLTLFTIASCSPSVVTFTTSGSISSGSISSGSISSESTFTSRPEIPGYSKYTLKEGVSDVSDFNGAPWLNVQKKGVINKIEKPSLKDDFYAYANYEYLQNIELSEGMARNGGVAVANDNTVDDCLDAIYDDPKTGLPAINQAVRFGSKDIVKQEINRLYNLSLNESLALFNSGYIFKGFSKLVVIDNRDNAGYTVSMLTQNVTGSSSKWNTPNLLRLAKSKGMGAVIDELNLLNTLYGNTNYSKSEMNQIGSMFEELSSSNGYQNVTCKVKELKNRYGNSIKFYEALKDIGFDEETTISIDAYTDAFLTRLSGYINTDPTFISKLLALNCILSSRFYLGWEDYCDFMNRLKNGYAGALLVNNFSDETALLEFVEDYFLDEYSCRLYIDRYIKEESKQKVATMINDIKAEYRKLFQSYTWLSDQTKTAVIDKLDAMKFNIFFEEDNSGFSIGNIDYSNLNVIQAMDKMEDYIVGSIANGSRYTFKSGLHFPPYYTDAGYQSGKNTFLIGHGEGASYLNKEDICDEELYAYMGTVIAHEITHGFDSTGSTYDKDGKKNETWASEDREKFNDKVLKLRNYMSENLVVLNDYPTNGSNWDKEVTADMGGLKLACLVASQKQNFDMDKFFKYYAHYFAYIATDEYIINTINGTHPIGYLRVNFILSQSEEFINYYNIKEGDMMYTSPDNIVAIW